MITISKLVGNPSVDKTNDYIGKSTDTKPLEFSHFGTMKPVPNASTFYEMDTQDMFMFDGDINDWIPQ